MYAYSFMIILITFWGGAFIIITVTFHGGIEKFSKLTNRIETVTVPDKTSVKLLLEILSMPKGSVEIITVNKKLACLETEISEGDTVDLYPMFPGG